MQFKQYKAAIVSLSKQRIELGQQYERDVSTILIDLSTLRSTYGEGSATLLVKRPGETEARARAATREGDVLRWVVTAADTQTAGTGKAVLRWAPLEGGEARSVVFDTSVRSSLRTAEGEVPEPDQEWYESVLAAADAVREEAEKIERAAGEAENALQELREGIECGDFKGEDGSDYVLTDADRQEISDMAAAAIQSDIKDARKDIAENRRDINVLYKVSRGQLWDIERVACEGNEQLHGGGVYGNVDEVYGRTEQESTPTPENPQEIKSVDSIHILRTDADGNTLEERTITPPSPLNRVGAYADKLDVVKGEWEYVTDKRTVENARLASYGKDGTGTYMEYSPLPPVKVMNTSTPPIAVSWAGVPYPSRHNGDNKSKYRFYTNEAGTTFWFETPAGSDISESAFRELIVGTDILFASSENETIPISSEDLDFLRKLTLQEGETLFVTDNHGRDARYLMSDFINLGKAVSDHA